MKIGPKNTNCPSTMCVTVKRTSDSFGIKRGQSKSSQTCCRSVSQEGRRRIAEEKYEMYQQKRS